LYRALPFNSTFLRQPFTGQSELCADRFKVLRQNGFETRAARFKLHAQIACLTQLSALQARFYPLCCANPCPQPNRLPEAIKIGLQSSATKPF
jgi:hypothetical protein